VVFFAPKASYSSAGGLGQKKLEFKEMVRAFPNAGIEVILDVVFNHTAEGDELGPTLPRRTNPDNRGGQPSPCNGASRAYEPGSDCSVVRRNAKACNYLELRTKCRFSVVRCKSARCKGMKQASVLGMGCIEYSVVRYKCNCCKGIVQLPVYEVGCADSSVVRYKPSCFKQLGIAIAFRLFGRQPQVQ
jgi:hypothetical protein